MSDTTQTQLDHKLVKRLKHKVALLSIHTQGGPTTAREDAGLDGGEGVLLVPELPWEDNVGGGGVYFHFVPYSMIF